MFSSHYQSCVDVVEKFSLHRFSSKFQHLEENLMEVGDRGAANWTLESRQAIETNLADT
jgi:hypothetical protein